MTLRTLALSTLAACCALAAPAAAGMPDWAALADVEEVDVITADEDGEVRETVIWFVVHEGVPYIRTSRGSRWGNDIEREADMVLRVEEMDFPLRATLVADEALLDDVHGTFREKYGWFDAVAGVMRGPNPRIMQLSPRD